MLAAQVDDGPAAVAQLYERPQELIDAHAIQLQLEELDPECLPEEDYQAEGRHEPEKNT